MPAQEPAQHANAHPAAHIYTVHEGNSFVALKSIPVDTIMCHTSIAQELDNLFAAGHLDTVSYQKCRRSYATMLQTYESTASSETMLVTASTQLGETLQVHLTHIYLLYPHTHTQPLHVTSALRKQTQHRMQTQQLTQHQLLHAMLPPSSTPCVLTKSCCMHNLRCVKSVHKSCRTYCMPCSTPGSDCRGAGQRWWKLRNKLHMLTCRCVCAANVCISSSIIIITERKHTCTMIQPQVFVVRMGYEKYIHSTTHPRRYVWRVVSCSMMSAR